MSHPQPSFRSAGEFIRSQRELLSLSIRELAEMAKVSNPYLSQIERGVYTPSAQVLKGIASALDISAETLYQQAGLLDETVERPTPGVEDAIRMDGRLTREGKQALIEVYRGLAGVRDGAARPTATGPAATTGAGTAATRRARATAKPRGAVRPSPPAEADRRGRAGAPARFADDIS